MNTYSAENGAERATDHIYKDFFAMKDFYGANLIDSTVNSTIIMDPTKRPDGITFFCFLF